MRRFSFLVAAYFPERGYRLNPVRQTGIRKTNSSFIFPSDCQADSAQFGREIYFALSFTLKILSLTSGNYFCMICLIFNDKMDFR